MTYSHFIEGETEADKIFPRLHREVAAKGRWTKKVTLPPHACFNAPNSTPGTFSCTTSGVKLLESRTARSFCPLLHTSMACSTT